MTGIRTGNTTVYTMRYDSLDNLLSRKEYMTKTVLNYLTKINKQNNLEGNNLIVDILDSNISFTKDKFLLNFKVGPVENK